MNEKHYILEGREIKEVDLMTWGASLKQDRKIGRTTVNDKYLVSTVFLGIDHSWGNGPPVLFETMVFDREKQTGEDLDCERYCTYDEAEEGHKKMVEKWSSK